VLLARTLSSTTFKLALLSIGIFGAVVTVIFSYVYWSTASYILGSSDQAIESELAILRKAYEVAGRSGLTSAIEERIRGARLEGGFYLLADPSFVRVAGNLKTWPTAIKAPEGRGSLTVNDWVPDGGERPLVRAIFATLPDDDHLLVGKDVSDLGQFASRMYTALAATGALLFVLAGVTSVMVTRRTVGRIEAVNVTSRAIMETGLDKRIPLRGTRDEWDQLAGNLNMMLDRIEGLMREVKQATDNVAHDLRTPLTRVRGRLEKACNE
jgi:signal transduction histidine kinase